MQKEVIKMKKILAIITVLFLSSCGSYDKYSKDDFLYSENHKDGIYSEYFRVASYGVGGDVYSVYITDSTSFRKHIMVYYDNDYINLNFSKDEVTINRMNEKKSPKEKAKRVKVEEVKLNIKDLRFKKIQE